MFLRQTTILCSLLIAASSFAQKDSDEAYLGVSYHHVSEDKAEKLGFETTQGAYVTKITQGSAAEASGIQAFDYIIGINNEEFTPDNSFSDQMEEIAPGDEAEFKLIRKGEVQSITAQVTNWPEETNYMYEDNNAYLGVYQSHKNVPDEIQGTRVSHVIHSTTASEIGMRSNDIILSINDNPIIDWTDLSTALDNTPTGDSLHIVFYRESTDKTFDRYAIAVDHGDEPILAKEFEEERGTLFLEQMNGSTMIKLIEGDNITSMVTEGFYVLVEGPEIANYDDLDYPEIIIKSDDYIIIKEDLIEEGESSVNSITELEVNADEFLHAFGHLSHKEEIETIAFENVSEDEAEEMMEDEGIEMPLENDLEINNITLFPNPNNGVFSLNFESPVEGSLEIRIYSADGKLVYTESNQDFSGQFIRDISLEDQERGIYFLMVQQNDQTYSKKFIVN
ncbi:MAG: PDZ domain-containing protein [Crocinitomicaceae bacterium]|nr:PDZ domain-containing protein [Crocinitomicaceae bacterium]